MYLMSNVKVNYTDERKKCISTDFRLLLSVINLSASFKAWFKTFGSYIYINILTKLLPLPAYYNIFFYEWAIMWFSLNQTIQFNQYKIHGCVCAYIGIFMLAQK